MKNIEINGERFSSLKEFYDEIERQFTRGLDWKIERNLDAFDDVLEGGFGMYDYEEEIEINWINSDKSRLILGYDETTKYLQRKLKNCHPTNKKHIKKELESSKKRVGNTLFEVI